MKVVWGVMNYLPKLSMLAIGLVSTFMAMPVAYAEDVMADASKIAESPHTLTANLGLFTDYTYRGISYTKQHGAIQGGIDYTHSSGFYAGTWATNVNSDALYGNTFELDVYGGFVYELAKQLELDVGLLQYYFPEGKNPKSGAANKGGSPNTTEFNAAITYKNFTLRHSYAASHFFGINHNYGGNGSSRGSGYTELNVNYELPVVDLNLALHVGHQAVRRYSQANYTDWLIGLNKDFSIAGRKGWNVGINYTTTNADKNWYVDAKGWETANSRLIAYIQHAF